MKCPECGKKMKSSSSPLMDEDNNPTDVIITVYVCTCGEVIVK